jgi:purine-nucleoside phosphorylase
MKNIGTPIIKPMPLRGWGNKNVLYIPIDSPKRTILMAIEQRIQKEKKTPLGTLFKSKGNTILYQCIGAPLAVLSLERLIISGAKEITILGFCGALNQNLQVGDAVSIVGFCGALNQNLQVGDAVSIVKAYSEEGTSSHYFSNRSVYRAGNGLRKKNEHFLKKEDLPFHIGTIVSTDAPYRESHTWLKQKQTKGIDCVDMETSAVFSLAEYYQISASALMLVSDKLNYSRHRFKFHSSKLETAIKRYFIPLIK